MEQKSIGQDFMCGGERSELEQILNKAAQISLANHEVIIWGAGNTTELNKRVIIEENLKPDFFVDNDKEKWGKNKWNIEVIAPEDMKIRCVDPVILISSADETRCQEIAKQLSEMGMSNFHMLDEVIWGKHTEELLGVYDILDSNYSKMLYVTIICARIMGKAIPEEYVKSEQYFAMSEFKRRNPKEIYIDCGAYVGDTLEKYLYIKDAVFDEIYAFEPVEENINAMSIRIERLQKEWGILENRINIIKGAVGKEKGEVFLNNDRESMSAKVTETSLGEMVHMYSIDSYFQNVDIGFIKADIEGYELDMIEGAAQSIKRNKPLLAICLYHQSSDLYKIPILLKKLNPEYKLNIIHHYYNYNETVLYAY